jgi:hypothetical protein
MYADLIVHWVQLYQPKATKGLRANSVTGASATKWLLATREVFGDEFCDVWDGAQKTKAARDGWKLLVRCAFATEGKMDDGSHYDREQFTYIDASKVIEAQYPECVRLFALAFPDYQFPVYFHVLAHAPQLMRLVRRLRLRSSWRLLTYCTVVRLFGAAQASAERHQPAELRTAARSATARRREPFCAWRRQAGRAICRTRLQ